jgi:hypothetical protein
MDPATLATVSLAGSVLSAGVGAFGALQSASAQSAAAKYQAQVAQNNQIIAQQNAAQAAQAGRSQAQAQDYANRARMGGIIAAEGASGIDTGAGSSKEVQASAAQLGRLDTANIMQRAMLQARQYNVQAMSEGAQAQLDTMQARQAQTAGLFSAAGSLLGGASSFADKWAKFQTAGVPGFA